MRQHPLSCRSDLKKSCAERPGNKIKRDKLHETKRQNVDEGGMQRCPCEAGKRIGNIAAYMQYKLGRGGNAKSKERQAAGHLPLPITIFVACRNLMAERLAEG